MSDEPDSWEPWTHASLDEALGEIKRRLDFVESAEYDGFLLELLKRRLEYRDHRYGWPRETRSGLLKWPAHALRRRA